MAVAESQATATQHAVKITPEMTESLEGEQQPLFRRRGKEKEKEQPRETEKQAEERRARLREFASRRGQQIKETIAPSRPEPPAPAARAAAPATTRGAAEPTRTTAPAPPAAAARAQVPGERSFPKTAEAYGYRGGTDRDYTVLTNEASLEEARQQIRKLGYSRAAAELAQDEDPGA